MIFPKTSTISKCKRTSARLRRIFCTPPGWILSLCGEFPDQASGPTSARATILREMFSKTKAHVVKFVEEAVADGAQVIQQQGDAGLDRTSKSFGNRMAHYSNMWTFAIEHSGEHYGQLVVYFARITWCGRIRDAEEGAKLLSCVDFLHAGSYWRTLSKAGIA